MMPFELGKLPCLGLLRVTDSSQTNVRLKGFVVQKND
jgi:hypothetical protein